MASSSTLLLPKRASAALVWLDLGHYHAARSRALHGQSTLAVQTVEVFGAAGFAHFRASSSMRDGFCLLTLGNAHDASAEALRTSVIQALDQIAPNVVFTPGWSMTPALAALEWCVAHRTPCVIMSDTVWEAQSRSIAKEVLKSRLVRLGQAGFVAGSAAAAYLAQLGMPEDRISLGFDAIDEQHFSDGAAHAKLYALALRERYGLPERYLLLCARLIPEKNLSAFLDALHAHREAFGDSALKVVQVGPGPLEIEIRAQVARLGLIDNFIMLGSLDYQSLPVLYGLADALILPSVSETWGLVVNEAMAAGLPVLVSELCGCTSDLVEHGGNGFVFNPRDKPAMTEALGKFARLSPEARASMGARSQVIIADWGLERFVKGFDAAANAALNAPYRPPSPVDRWLLKAVARR
jgi:1,2-diacylglycerol 3-alpha-glucosyltransferase